MGWKTYAAAMLVFNLVGLLVVYPLQRFQGVLPLNPAGPRRRLAPTPSFNTAVSFATNTNWQGYGGESHHELSHPDARARPCRTSCPRRPAWPSSPRFIRGFARRSAQTIGNFWVDLTRTTLYILLPLSFVLALVLVSQGVVQTFGAVRRRSPCSSPPLTRSP